MLRADTTTGAPRVFGEKSPSSSLTQTTQAAPASGTVRRRILGHTAFAAVLFVLYVALNRQEIILISRLGITAWYPAGLGFAIMLGISPLYMPVFALAGALASVWIYHQPILSCSTVVAPTLCTGVYAYIAHVLRRVIKIDTSLSQGRSVVRYLSGALSAAVLAALIGAACLCADHAIPLREFASATLVWYLGDAIALFSLGPFLLIHVLPWLRSQWRAKTIEAEGSSSAAQLLFGKWEPFDFVEVVGQAIALGLLLWFTTRGPGSEKYYYLSFLPIIWIAIRRGVRGSVTGLLFLNFGIVCSLHFSGISLDALNQLGGLMLVVSGTGLILGSVTTERQSTALELREGTSFLKQLIQNSPFAMAVVGTTGRVELINETFTDIFKYKPADIVGKNLQAFILPEGHEADVEKLRDRLTAGQTLQRNVRRMRKDGEMVNVSLHAIPWTKNGKLQGGYLIYKDISEQLKAAQAAEEHQEEMRRWVGELELRTVQITLLNEMAGLLQCAESRREAYAIAEQSLKKLFVGTHSGALFILNVQRNALETAVRWGETDHAQNDFAPTQCRGLQLGRPHWSECPGELVCEHVNRAIEASYLCVPLMAHEETLGILHIRCEANSRNSDIEAEQKALEGYKRLAVAAASQIALSLANLRLRETLREQSIRDPLTGLYNRRFLQEALEKELQRAVRKERPVSVIFLDIDHFKKFNDEFGHDAGDSVLTSMADILRLHFRAEDLVCRYGGEEFAVVLPEATLQDALARAEELRKNTREFKLVHRGVLLRHITISAGIAVFPEHGQSGSELLARADACLYQSKENGRDRVTAAEVAGAVTIPAGVDLGAPSPQSGMTL
jgi:diguanylate cyclase (GGDEF)-like protein/PAS domain S-box-containing protein